MPEKTNFQSKNVDFGSQVLEVPAHDCADPLLLAF
jgi:hypothetical protein